MAKSLMLEVANLLGVELGEMFIIKNTDRNVRVVLAFDGLHVKEDDFFGRFLISNFNKYFQVIFCSTLWFSSSVPAGLT